MLFVFYSIDVIFLDKHKEVVEIKRRLKQFTLYMPKNKAKYVIETVPEKLDVEVGEKIKFT